MPRLFVAVMFCVAAVSAARAAEFSWEPSGFASSIAQHPVLDVDRSSLAVSYYFEPVDDATGPYGLAAFLDPATRVAAAVDREESRVHAGFFGPFQLLPDSVTDTDEYSVGGRYVFPTSRWYVGGRYRTGNVDESLRPIQTTDLEGYGALVGKYLGAATTLELAYDSADRQTACSFAPCLLSITEKTETDEWGIAAQHVLRGRALTYSLSARIDDTRAEVTIRLPPPILRLPPPGVVFGPVPPGAVVGGFVTPVSPVVLDLGDFRVYSVAGELFPTQRVGVRLGYSRWDGDSSIDDAYNVTATWFVTRHAGLAFTFARQHGAGVLGDAGDTVALRIVGRL